MDEKKVIDLCNGETLTIEAIQEWPGGESYFLVRDALGTIKTRTIEMDGVRFEVKRQEPTLRLHVRTTRKPSALAKELLIYIRVLMNGKSDLVKVGNITGEEGGKYILCKDLAQAFNESLPLGEAVGTTFRVTARTVGEICRNEFDLSTMRLAAGYALILVDDEIDLLAEKLNSAVNVSNSTSEFPCSACTGSVYHFPDCPKRQKNKA